MKKLIFLVFTFICLSSSLLVKGQEIITPSLDFKTWGKYDMPHVVSIGSSFDYAVEKHFTLTLEQLKQKLTKDPAFNPETNPNRYVWELYKIDSYDDKTDPTKVTYVNPLKIDGFDAFFTNEVDRYNQASVSPANIGLNSVKFVWREENTTPGIGYGVKGIASDQLYLMRVSEYTNHANDGNASSKQADMDTKMVSEIIVKIGEKVQIYLPDPINREGFDKSKLQPGDIAVKRDGSDIDSKELANTDFYFCDKGTPTDVETLDNLGGMIILKFNGRPGTIKDAFKDGYKFKLRIEKTKDDADAATGVASSSFTEEIELSLPLAECISSNKLFKYYPSNGYFTYAVGLKELHEALKVKDATKFATFDLDATNFDIFYEVTLLGYLHGDSYDADKDGDLSNDFTPVLKDVMDGLNSGTYTDVKNKGKKVLRRYGFYTMPKITKINHK